MKHIKQLVILLIVLILPLDAMANSTSVDNTSILKFSEKIQSKYGFNMKPFIENEEYTIKYDEMEDTAIILPVNGSPFMLSDDYSYNYIDGVDIAFVAVSLFVTNEGVLPILYFEFYPAILSKTTQALEKVTFRINDTNYPFEGDSVSLSLGLSYVPLGYLTSAQIDNGQDLLAALTEASTKKDTEMPVRFTFTPGPKLDVKMTHENIASILNTYQAYVSSGLKP